MSDDTPVAKDPPRGPCYEYQNDHISATEFFEQIEAVPKAELRELIEEYREKPFDCVDGAAARDREEQLLEKLEALLDE